nr:putative reverse transcriptase domain-containing protein [Tanacetum cinerariifolium]
PVSLGAYGDERVVGEIARAARRIRQFRSDAWSKGHDACLDEERRLIQAEISEKMSVALYGRKCRLPVLWAEIGEGSLIEPELRLPEELNSVHDTFHMSNLKADANLHVPLDEIKVEKTLRFVEEPIEIMEREINWIKRKSIVIMKVRWNSKRGPEFTWEHEDQVRDAFSYGQELLLVVKVGHGVGVTHGVACLDWEAAFEHSGSYSVAMLWLKMR